MPYLNLEVGSDDSHYKLYEIEYRIVDRGYWGTIYNPQEGKDIGHVYGRTLEGLLINFEKECDRR